ncbi:MAG: CHAT domain-containing protein [Candidatus Eremiobacteraeota bacterium]|nr:CHAT domain-containing protein [Candidatus Eremiobacteraeota bacterium]
MKSSVLRLLLLYFIVFLLTGPAFSGPEAEEVFLHGADLAGKGAYYSACDEFMKASALYEAAGDRNGQARALCEAGKVMAFLGESSRALALYKDARARSPQGTMAGLYMAALELDLGSYDEALETLRSCDKEATLCRKFHEGLLYFETARALAGKGDNAGGARYFHRAREAARTRPWPFLEGLSLAFEGTCRGDLLQPERALPLFREAEGYTAGDPSLRALVAWREGAYFQSHGSPEGAVLNYRQAVAAAGEEGGRLPFDEALLFPSPGRDIFESLIMLLMDGGREEEAYYYCLLCKETDFGLFLERSLPGTKRAPVVPSLQEIRFSLAPSGALLEFFTGRKRSYCWYIDSDTLEGRILDPAKGGVAEGAVSLIAAAKSPLFFVPDAGLISFPFTALVDSKGVPYGTKATVTIVPSTAELVYRVPGSPAGMTASLLCALGESPALPPLPASLEELAAVSPFCAPRIVLSAGEMRRDRVIPPLKDSRLAFLATWTLRRNGFPGLTLADGLLLPSDILSLPSSPPLVVLSLYSPPGSTRNEGDMLFFVRSFCRAGSAEVFLAREGASPQARKTFLSALFKALRDGATPDEAVRMWLGRNPENRKDPSTWSPFVLFSVSPKAGARL